MKTGTVVGIVAGVAVLGVAVAAVASSKPAAPAPVPGPSPGPIFKSTTVVTPSGVPIGSAQFNGLVATRYASIKAANPGMPDNAAFVLAQNEIMVGV
jgi:hypothetical protein